MASHKYIREDSCSITVLLAGNDLKLAGLWATAEGGDLEADSQKTRPGGLANQESAGGPASRNDMTATIQLSELTVGVVDKFEDACGKRRMDIKVEFRDPESTAVLDDIHRTGTVKSVATPDMDVNGSAISFLSVVMDCDEKRA
jgi:hypothetical protein